MSYVKGFCMNQNDVVYMLDLEISPKTETIDLEVKIL